MKKITLAAVSLLALSFMSCGDKYAPLTEEAKAAKADSIFNATAVDLRAAKEASCNEGMQAMVDTKVAEMIAEPTATN